MNKLNTNKVTMLKYEKYKLKSILLHINQCIDFNVHVNFYFSYVYIYTHLLILVYMLASIYI